MDRGIVRDSGLTQAFSEGFAEARPSMPAKTYDIRLVCYQGGRVRKNVTCHSVAEVLDLMGRFITEYIGKSVTFDVIPPEQQLAEIPPVNLADPDQQVIDAEVVDEEDPQPVK